MNCEKGQSRNQDAYERLRALRLQKRTVFRLVGMVSDMGTKFQLLVSRQQGTLCYDDLQFRYVDVSTTLNFRRSRFFESKPYVCKQWG